MEHGQQLRIRERDEVVIVDMVGDFGGDTVKESLYAVVEKYVQAGKSQVVLSLKDATYINSNWLGAIVYQFTKLSQIGGHLKLANVPPRMMDLLVLTKLAVLFDIFTNEDDAINSFFPSRPLRYPRMLRGQTLSQQPSTQQGQPLCVFLCHSSQDKPAVRDLYRQLLRTGAKIWLDEEDLLPGQLWEREIPAAVKRSDAILVCLSRAAVSRTGYLHREIKYALDAAEEQSDESIFLIPARLEECDVPERLRKWQWVDLFVENGLDRLFTALQARALALQRRPLHTSLEPDQ